MKNKPSIPIETQKKMHAFFMKTSAPRLVAKMKEEQLQGGKVEQ